MAAKLEMYHYSVTCRHGDHTAYSEVRAAYVKNEDGLLSFKNAAHETVLLVNAAHVLTVARGDIAAAAIVPAEYVADGYGNTQRVPVDEAQLRPSTYFRRDNLPDKGGIG